MKEEAGNNEIKPKAETADVGQTTDEESVNVGTEVVESASEARQELKRLVEEQAREDERPLAGEFKLAKILGGEFLTAKIIRQQLWLILLVVGFTVQVALQAVLNVAVVTNTIPNTGISLPFFSSGGTSLMMLLGEMGIVLSVSRGET